MNKRQRNLIIKLISIVVVTVAFVSGIAIYKDIIIRKEAIRAIDIIAQEIAIYKNTVGSLPSDMYLERIREEKGLVRLGDFNYRARWIEFNSPEDTIVAYSALRTNNPIVQSGYILIRLKDIYEAEEIIEANQNLEKLQSQLKGLSEKSQSASDIAEKISEYKKRLADMHEKKQDGTCEQLSVEVFERVLHKQQSEAEIEVLLRSREQLRL